MPQHRYYNVYISLTCATMQPKLNSYTYPLYYFILLTVSVKKHNININLAAGL